MARVTAFDGHVFAMQCSGEGVPILLLHDMAATHRAWDPLRGALSRSHAVRTWDARGHGAARGTPETAVPTLGLLAADLNAAIDAGGAHRQVLVGHGLGALTILEHLRNYGSDRVSRVVLVDQSPRMLSAPGWPLGLFGGFDASEADARLAQLDTRRRRLRAFPRGSMLALWHSMTGRDYRDEIAALQVPLLVVLGGCSAWYDASRLGRWFQAYVPAAEVRCYPDADHAPQVAEPARFVADIVAFAERPDAAPAPRLRPTSRVAAAKRSTASGRRSVDCVMVAA